jgi:hypothetical protein
MTKKRKIIHRPIIHCLEKLKLKAKLKKLPRMLKNWFPGHLKKSSKLDNRYNNFEFS